VPRVRITFEKGDEERIAAVLTPNGNELWAEYALQPAAVLVSDQMVSGGLCESRLARFAARGLGSGVDAELPVSGLVTGRSLV